MASSAVCDCHDFLVSDGLVYFIDLVLSWVIENVLFLLSCRSEPRSPGEVAAVHQIVFLFARKTCQFFHNRCTIVL